MKCVFSLFLPIPFYMFIYIELDIPVLIGSSLQNFGKDRYNDSYIVGCNKRCKNGLTIAIM